MLLSQQPYHSYFILLINMLMFISYHFSFFAKFYIQCTFLFLSSRVYEFFFLFFLYYQKAQYIPSSKSVGGVTNCRFTLCVICEIFIQNNNNNILFFVIKASLCRKKSIELFFSSEKCLILFGAFFIYLNFALECKCWVGKL